MPNETRRVVLAAAGLAALAVAAFVARDGGSPVNAATDADEMVADWPAFSMLTAKTLIARYGMPRESGPNSLTWSGPGAWKRTVLRRTDADGNILEQTVSDAVPEDKIAELRRFDARVRANPAARELSVSADNPATNFLLANLAHEIAGGLKTVPEARRFYAKELRLSEAGKSSDYLVLLRFAGPPAEHPGERPARLGAPRDLELEK